MAFTAEQRAKGAATRKKNAQLRKEGKAPPIKRRGSASAAQAPIPVAVVASAPAPRASRRAVMARGGRPRRRSAATASTRRPRAAAATGAERKAIANVKKAEANLAKVEAKVARRAPAGGATAWIRRNEMYVDGGLILLGAVMPDRIDALVPNFRPLGASVPPSVMAVPLALVASWIAKKYKHPQISRGLKVFSFGLVGGLLQRAIAKKSLASGVSGAEDVSGTPPVD